MSLSSADRVEIHELYARYAMHFDGGDARAWAALFSESGRFFLPDQPPVTGRDALEAFARERIAQAPGIRHFTTNIAVDDGADGPIGHAYTLVVSKRPGEPLQLRTLGDYADELENDDGSWHFRSRRFTPWILPEETGKVFAFDVRTRV